MRGTVLPVKEYKEMLVIQRVHKLTRMERLKLIFGFNIYFEGRICCEHRTGRTTQKVAVKLTKLEKTPPAAILDDSEL